MKQEHKIKIKNDPKQGLVILSKQMRGDTRTVPEKKQCTGCPFCGNNSFVITDDKPMREKCMKCGHSEVWHPGEIKCVVCTKHIREDQKGFSIRGHPAHKKCMIAYTAWEVERENPGISEAKSRMLQTQKNLEHLYRRLESGNQP